MPRHPRALLAAGAFAVLLAACGSQDATQGSVRDDVKSTLLRTQEGISDEEAGVVADCVARGLFESGDFSPEERNDATSADDGDDPDPDLAAKVEALFDRCQDEATES